MYTYESLYGDSLERLLEDDLNGDLLFLVVVPRSYLIDLKEGSSQGGLYHFKGDVYLKGNEFLIGEFYLNGDYLKGD